MGWHQGMAGTYLAVMLYCVFTPFTNGGNCWIVGKNGRCTDLLESEVSREECCAQARVAAAWSPQDLEGGRLFFWRALGGGVPCRPCKASCAKVKCPAGQRCKKRGGVPRCVCALKCRAAKLRSGRRPVCGTDGRTYRNICKLLRRQCRRGDDSLRIAYKGVCQASCDKVTCANEGEQCVLDQNTQPHCVRCLRPCKPGTGSPVCGVDGVTYSSRCHARRAACLLGRAIPIAYWGPCQPAATCSTLRCKSGQRCLVTPEGSSPRCTSCQLRCRRQRGSGQPRVCGNNHVTYRSWCHMMKDSCSTGLVIDVLHVGSCYRRRYTTASDMAYNATATIAQFPFLLSSQRNNIN